ncbi:hypothetical protein [Falsibacillus pallidus]|uniref:Uncharacterized protein n=1 Tax=Falsibacillus pallidus TaxID=493781 RepID=A0A370G0M0_9BACI|nr:hypothetical protein [Falsibacillus pallidus]RDI36449.1 hypothetical protein DFR59_1306 [Falsibacillus pallidus]
MTWILYYILFQLVVILLFWFISKKKDGRYKQTKGKPLDGFEPTKEVSIDPVTGRKSRVYMHPETGERVYIEE